MGLRAHREAAPLSIRELAQAAGVAPDTIVMIEHGRRKRIRPATKRRIAGALGVSVADIAEFAPAVEARPAPPVDRPAPPKFAEQVSLIVQVRRPRKG